MLSDILKFIITGLPHSGTTPLSDIFRNVPGFFSGFECGFLLNHHPRDFINPHSNSYKIYYDNLKYSWKLNDKDIRYISDSDDWEQAYRKLRDKCPLISDKKIKLFDKTPNYIYSLEDVIKRSENVPIIVIFKDPRLQYWSYKKRNYHDYDKFLNLFNDIFFDKLMTYSDQGKIHLIKYEDMCIKREDEIKKIFDFLNIEFKNSYLEFNSKYQPQYGNGIETKYIYAYKDKLSDQEVNKITSKVSNPFFYTELPVEYQSNTYSQEAPDDINHLKSLLIRHRHDAYQILKGNGIEVGAFNQPAFVPKECHIEYCDVISKADAIKNFPEIKIENLVEVQHLCDLDKGGLSGFSQEQFDFVIMNNVIEHVANPIKAINEIFRVLKTDGLAIISTFDKDYSHLKKYQSIKFETLLYKFENNASELTAQQYNDSLSKAIPDLAEKTQNEIEKIILNAQLRREFVFFWDSNSFRTFLEKSFNILNIDAKCVFESRGKDNKIEYFSIWKKQKNNHIMRTIQKFKRHIKTLNII